ncbi:MAG: group 1 truncated hemoglobin [Myxococcales bacterium]|nr:group 1 truncated hemoglobin [Myxococcales bacterium]
MSDFDELGGEPALRAIIDDFVDTVFDDPMIGFFFRGIDRRRIKELEYQHAAEHLGADVSYRGRPLGQAHRAHRIMGGQFARRSKLLEQALARHGVPEAIAARWLAHTESLRPEITQDPGGQCND